MSGMQCYEHKLSNLTSINANVLASESMFEPIELGKEQKKITVTLYGFEINNSIQHLFYTTESEDAKEERYNITIYNDGDVALKGVQVTADMAKGIKFINSVYFGYRQGLAKPDVVDPPIFDETKRTIVKWEIGELLPLGARFILFRAYLKKNINNTDIKVKVNDSAPIDAQISEDVDRAEYIEEGSYVDIITQDECSPNEQNKDRCIKVSPDWVIQMI